MRSRLFDSILDGIRHRFGSAPSPEDGIGDYHPTDKESRDLLDRHNDAEARVVGRTMGYPDGIRAFGKGRPR